MNHPNDPDNHTDAELNKDESSNLDSNSDDTTSALNQQPMTTDESDYRVEEEESLSGQNHQEVVVEDQSVAASISDKKRSSPLATALSLLSLLLVLGLAGGAYWLWQTGQIHFNAESNMASTGAEYDASSVNARITKLADTMARDRRNEIARIEKRMGELQNAAPGTEGQNNVKGELDKLGTQLNQMQQALSNSDQSVRKQLNEAEKNIARQARRLEAMANISREDWLMAEVEYLLKLAHQRIRIEGDVDNAQAMIEEAVAIVRDLENPELYPLREQLAKDLLDVKMVERIDTDGIYLSLSALADQVFKLPVSMTLEKKMQRFSEAKEVNTAETEIGENPQGTAEALPWYKKPARAIADFGRGFDKYIQVRKNESAPSFMMTVENETYLKQNLRLMLEKAQLALLKNDNTIFSRTIQSAQEWVTNYFPQSSKKQAFLSELAALQSVSLEREMPDLTASQKMISDLINTYHNNKALGLSFGDKRSNSKTSADNASTRIVSEPAQVRARLSGMGDITVDNQRTEQNSLQSNSTAADLIEGSSSQSDSGVSKSLSTLIVEEGSL